jgi:hypothetical protein
MTIGELRNLKMTINRLRSLSTPGGEEIEDALGKNMCTSSCGVDDEYKKGVMMYVRTWVLPTLEAIAKPAKERDRYDKNLCDPYN